MDASRHAGPVLRQGRGERGLTQTRPTRPPSLRTRPQMRGNPTTSTPISPHKATDAGEPDHLDPHLSAQTHRRGGTRPPQPPSLRTNPQTRGNPTTSAPISPHKATDAGQPDHLSPHLSAQSHRRGATRPPQPPSLRTKPQTRGNLKRP